MWRIEAGTTGKYCDGMSRRSFVQLGVAGMGSAGLAEIMRAKQASAATNPTTAKDTSVILIWLDGGPSHMDLYDMKPEAPAEYRGIWRPIPTNVSGFEITELFPLQAKVADKFSIVRSLHHDTGDHFAGGHWMLTSRGGASGADTAGRYPSIASIATKLTGARRPAMPPYVAVPYAASIGLRPGYFGANYLGIEHNPFETEGDPNADGFQVHNVRPPAALTIDRLGDRRGLLGDLDRFRREVDRSGAVDAMDRFQRDAYELVAGSTAAKAFDIDTEDPKLREFYGRHNWGQSVLLARRLVEAGTTFVTVHFGGWDHHWDLQKGMETYLPIVDRAVAALFEDLSQRGLLEKVLVVLCGEFSRTPRMNNGGNGGPPLSMGTPGRDHWGNSMFCLLGGGGVKGGRIVGSTNRLGEVPQDRPLEPCDLHATMYHVLGVDQHVSFLNHAGRPVPAIDRGEVIHELF
ncbi:MAG TPA: DUF1501 domain-containing protein [Pirellulales bacterium]|nr:DUF1501 domain-containing protein [Pirellulales bacterium]